MLARLVRGVMRILEARVPTRDVEAMRAFYADALGLPVAPTPQDAAEGAFGVRVGGSKLVFEPAAARNDPGPCHFALNVPENQIREARDWIAQRAPILSHGEDGIIRFESWNAHAVYFRDPGGHVVELIARHGLENASRGSFGPASLLEVSEVGIPVPDVLAAVRLLEEALGETPWRPAFDKFAPVGDERGLLILVRQGRFWFPSDEAAAACPRVVRVAAARAFDGAPPALGFLLNADGRR